MNHLVHRHSEHPRDASQIQYGRFQVRLAYTAEPNAHVKGNVTDFSGNGEREEAYIVCHHRWEDEEVDGE